MLAIDRSSASPLHKQIYDGYRASILRGDLRSGEQVPSSREFAAELRVSRFPVLNAYAQLLAEGYFESRVGAGTFVSGSLPEQLMSVAQDTAESAPGFPIPAGLRAPSGPRPVSRRSGLYPTFPFSPILRGWGSFGVHQPALDQFPFPIWANLVGRHSRNPHVRAIHHIDPRGSERFRNVICDYLRTARGVKCEPDQILIVSGSQQALDITARVLLDPGNQVWVEEPGYVLERIVLTAAGCRLIPVPVDQEGMVVSAGVKRAPKARAAFVTPSHQYPLGSTMSRWLSTVSRSVAYSSASANPATVASSRSETARPATQAVRSSFCASADSASTRLSSTSSSEGDSSSRSRSFLTRPASSSTR